MKINIELDSNLKEIELVIKTPDLNSDVVLIKELVEKLGIEVEEVKSSGLEESKKIIDKFDLVFCSEKLAKELEANPKIKVLKNLLDVNELKNYLQEL